MSGHSHFATIKRKKEIEDQKRGKIFSKLGRMISITAKEGSDPEMNPRLRQAIEEAKKFNMPKNNIERAIKKGAGELEGEILEEVSYEVLGPNGISLIVNGITDNKNRTLLEVKQALQKHNYKLANEGSVKWAFEHNGIIIVQARKDKDELEMKVIEAGAEDTKWINHDGQDFLEIKTKPDELDKVKKDLEEYRIKIESASLDWIAKEGIDVPEANKEKYENLFEELDDNDDIQVIYSNLKI